ncbi:hypothetical protein [Kingella denitrificans]|uniref:Uncharacterized protein n=1 Tax=Kingella denitrificans ATCC 33394 TaxID=888741 RepID=F0F2W3_9NEIS|nr:hypothetical protein [Kingella denitrificans]EGC16125.1 hypothetical protein HMPREF9098_2448 [Kingella denitrificans ATCC 33394]QQB42776.1 hypothetical protein I6I17_04420 [Kingella denitrificans]
MQAAFSSQPNDEKQPALLLNNPVSDGTISNAPTINQNKGKIQTQSRNTKNVHSNICKNKFTSHTNM